MRILAVACLALAAAACSQEPAPADEPTLVEAPGPELGGVDLSQPVRLLGTEPFWSIDLTGSEVVYAGVDRPEQRGPQPKPLIQGTVATLETATAAGTPVAITLTETECSDGMSDRTYPLTAIVKVGEETLMGCAASTAALTVPGERGPVGDAAAAQPAG